MMVPMNMAYMQQYDQGIQMKPMVFGHMSMQQGQMNMMQMHMIQQQQQAQAEAQALSQQQAQTMCEHPTYGCVTAMKVLVNDYNGT